MLRPQDIGVEGADEPLVKVEFASDYERISWTVLIIGTAVAALVYALGATIPLAGLNGVAFGIAIVTVITFAAVKGKAKNIEPDEQQVDAAVERFKQDLVDTYNGYDVEYSAREILSAADQYRKELLSEGSGGDAGGGGVTAVDVAREMGTDMVSARSKRKAARAERKAVRKGGRS